ncbi:MAG: hypothetical protein BWY09_01020 [Candidatus Hydrogenedentes bacterium ADurb.Bin179]|nr:MAG: hypothetical protein BWY09_01020 [Candidatus Hydrogenedentes bacterium ADurb.Bin179]
MGGITFRIRRDMFRPRVQRQLSFAQIKQESVFNRRIVFPFPGNRIHGSIFDDKTRGNAGKDGIGRHVGNKGIGHDHRSINTSRHPVHLDRNAPCGGVARIRGRYGDFLPGKADAGNIQVVTVKPRYRH